VLHRIIYLSSAVGLIGPSVLADILDVCRRNNKADGITGALFFHEGNFIQVLEGPKDRVMACYSRIVQDERHSGCIVLEFGAVDARNFASWDMAYVPVCDLPEDQRAHFIDLSELSRSDKMAEIERDEFVAVFMNLFLRGVRSMYAA